MTGVLHVEHVMGTAVTIDVRWPDAGGGRLEADPQRAAEAITGAVAVLHETDRVFSTWRTDSDLSQVRRGERCLDQCDPNLTTVADLCAAARLATDGWFDPWRMPGGFDPTGLVKGWAASRASDVLSLAGFTDHCVNAGGDLCVQGNAHPSPDDDVPAGWRVGVTDPFDRGGAFVEVITLAGGGALATSGGYERGSLARDPRSGGCVSRLASATVTGPDLAFADALATAATADGPEAITWLERMPDYAALLIHLDATITTTTRWPGGAAVDTRVRAGRANGALCPTQDLVAMVSSRHEP